MSERKARWGGGRAMAWNVSAKSGGSRPLSPPAGTPSPTQENLPLQVCNICTLQIELADEISQLVAHLHFRVESDDWENPNIFLGNTVSIKYLYHRVALRFIIWFHWQTIAHDLTMANNIRHASAPLPPCTYVILKIKERAENLPFITRSEISLPFLWRRAGSQGEKN